jgi:RNA polymerase sigma factor (sigma-70 family)
METDRTLVRACLRGDTRAWETLVHRYERLIYSIPRRCGLGEEDSADVFQTVCVRLLENLERLRDQEKLASWLITTANRESWRVKKLRQRSVSLSETGDEDSGVSPLENLPATDPLPHEVVARLEDEQIVREALQQITDRCRRLLTLLYHTDPVPAYSEIGAQMGMPEGSIGPTRMRCLQQLRKALQKHGF